MAAGASDTAGATLPASGTVGMGSTGGTGAPGADGFWSLQLAHEISRATKSERRTTPPSILAPNPSAGLKLLNRWCDSNWGLACGQLMGLYEDGRLLWGWNKKDADFPKDAAKGAAARKKYCALKNDDSRCKG